MPSPEVSRAPFQKLFSGHTVRLTSLVIGVLMIAVAGIVAYLTESRVRIYRDWVVHTYEVRREIDQLRSTINDLRATGLVCVLRCDTSETQHFDDQLAQVDRTIGHLKSMSTDNPDQQQRLADITMPIAKQVQLLKFLVTQPDRYAPNSTALADSLQQISGQRVQIENMLDDLDSAERKLLYVRLNRWNVLYGRNLLTFGIMFAASVLLLIYNFHLLLSELAWRREREEVDRQNLESYRALSARILELQDNERRRIARDLHDSVGQFLSGMKLNLGQLRRVSAHSQEGPAILSDTIDLADRAIGEVRTLSHLLHPPLLDELGFESAARWYIEGFAKRSGIKIVVEIAEIAERLPREVELALFRVLQESLTNVHRHARAANVLIDVKCTDDQVILIVHDDGRGVPREVLQSFRDGLAGGIGLAGMRERLAELSGTLGVESDKTGTTVRAALPTVLCVPDDGQSVTIFNG